MTRTWPLPLLLLSLAPACGGADVGPKPRLWTMADLESEAAKGFPNADSCDNPAGLECSYFVTEGDPSDPVQPENILHLKLSFSETWPAAYITTDFWQNYDEIWLQPMYFLVTSYDAGNPGAHRLPDDDKVTPTGPIFSVGPGSAFYSPYWQVFYVEVAAGTPPDKYTSARQLFDDGLVMHPGRNRYASIAPADMYPPSATDIADITPTLGDYLNVPAGQTVDDVITAIVASAQRFAGWLDGAAVSYIDFGVDGFSADADSVVQDIPLFAFKQVDSTHPELGLQLLPVPFVGGVAPLFSGISGQVGGDNRPHFGGLWRLHFVTLPPAAGPFSPMIKQALMLSGPGVDDHVNRVALNAAQCFASASAYGSCFWLDSQAKIEQSLGPGAIERSPYEPACPFVAWHGAPVPNPVPVLSP